MNCGFMETCGTQQRLSDVVVQDNAAAPILICGDVHMIQFMCKDCRNHDSLGRDDNELYDALVWICGKSSDR